MIALADGASPTKISDSLERYPLERLIEFIDAAQLGTATNNQLTTASHHPVAVFRYWAVTATLRQKNPPNFSSALNDIDASVRLAAAEAVLRRGANDTAWQVMADSLAATQSRELRLAALNALTYLPPAPATLTPLIAACAKSDDEYLKRAGEFLAAH